MDAGSVKSVVVVGAGVMGHSIGQVFAAAGISTHLVDTDGQRLDRAVKKIESNLEVLVEAGKVAAEDIPAILSRVHPTTDLRTAAHDADFALEAVTERPDIKKKIFSQLEEFCPPDGVLASNTSSLDVFGIADIKTPERMVVTHWFEPAHILPLVEVVPGPATRPDVVAFTADLMKRIGKRPLVMKQFVQSFVVNRIQRSIGQAITELLNNGWATPEEIDQAVKLSLGIRLPILGVVQRLDFAGIDLAYDIMKGLGNVDPMVEELVKQGRLGVKTSRGFYDYGGRTPEEILKKRDRRYLELLDFLERIDAFEPI